MKYEFKYIVPVCKMDNLREAMLPYIDQDPFAALMDSGEYTVRSIYYDSMSFDYYFEKVDGIKIRKKIRIRGYNRQNGNDTVFMEIKRKVKGPIEKVREELTFDVMKRLMEGEKLVGCRAEEHESIWDDGARKFLYHVYRNNLKPVVLVIYDREAFHDRSWPPSRITIDKNLRSVAFPCLDDLYCEENVIPALKDHFILEVKFFNHFPTWLRPITARFGLLRQSASKYISCVNSHKLTSTSRQAGMHRIIHWKSL